MPAAETPRQEVIERIAESSPAWGIPYILGIENLRSHLAMARGRVADSHKAQMNALGKATGQTIEPSTEGDDMGGISVAGDTNITITAPAPPASSRKVAGPAGPFSGVLPLVLGAALGGGAGLAIPAIAGLLTDYATPAVPHTDSAWQLGLEVKDTP